MCRLFGFRSAVNIGVHHSLVLAENALAQQSESNPDGWGIGFFEGTTPILRRGLSKAIGDGDFTNLARFVRSQAVIAHVRLGTVGGHDLTNTHPFSAGRWVFAHNGTLQGLEHYERLLMDEIDPEFRPLVQGETDSERCFYLFLTQLGLRGVAPESPAPGIVAFDAMRATIGTLCRLAQETGAPPPLIILGDGWSLDGRQPAVVCFLHAEALRKDERLLSLARWSGASCMHPLRAKG